MSVPAGEVQPAAQPITWRRQLWRLLGWLALGYLGILLLLMFLENTLVYPATKAAQHWEPAPGARFQDVWLEIPGPVRIHSWWLPQEGADGAILYAHGNGGNLSHRGRSLLALAQEMKMSVLIFDYPGYGKSGGSPSEQGCYAAGLAAYDWLVNEQKIPGEKILLYGGSLGGGVAVEIATRRPHRGLLLAKTFTSLPDVGARQYPWLPVRWVMRNRFDNLRKIGSIHRPVVITHGDCDELIPCDHGERLYEAANQPKLFHPLPGGDHNSPLPVEFFREARRFLVEVEAAAAK